MIVNIQNIGKGEIVVKHSKKIAVIGAGTMGAGMAVQYAGYGHEVMLYSRTQETLERARKTMEKSCRLLGEEGVISREMANTAMERICGTTDLNQAVKDAWYVVETIAERADAKTALYQQLDGMLKEDVILSSNTSYMNVFELIPDRRQPYTLIAHWFAPAHILPLVEIVKGPCTREDVVERMIQFHRNCGKTTIRMERYVPGFIINRLQSAMTREVLYLLENGYCSAQDIDLAVKTSLMPRGLALGLVQRMDFSGMDTVANGLRNGTYTPAPAPAEDNLVLRHAQNGELGVKSGVGFYRYDHKPYEEILDQRDRQLMRGVRLEQEFRDQMLHRDEEKDGSGTILP